MESGLKLVAFLSVAFGFALRFTVAFAVSLIVTYVGTIFISVVAFRLAVCFTVTFRVRSVTTITKASFVVSASTFGPSFAIRDFVA